MAVAMMLGGVSFVSAQGEVSYTLNEVSGETIIRSTAKTGVPGSISVPYHKYTLYDGVLYTKGVTSKQYNATVTLEAEGDVLSITGYSDSKKNNVVFAIEGEDIEGSTISGHANTLIRASNSATAYAENDLTVTTLPAAKYRVTFGCFDTSKAGNTAEFNFTCGEDVEFSIISAGNNLSEVTKDFTIFSEQPLVWKAGGSAEKSIDYIFIQRMGDATTEVRKFNYTVNGVDSENNILAEIASGIAEEASTIKVAYSTYLQKGGVLYKSSVTNKEYNYSFDLTADNQVENIKYATTDKTDIVYLSEGEDIEGMTPCTHSNTAIRSSHSASAYAADADVKFTTLPAGKYILSAVIFDSAKTPDSHWIFKAGETEIADLNCTAVNFQELSSDEFTLSEETDLYIAQGGSGDRGIDLVYIQKTGDYDPVANAIESAESASQDGAIYTIAGQRVEKAVKGLYIQNGKKFIVK